MIKKLLESGFRHCPDFIRNFLEIHGGKTFFIQLVSEGLGIGTLYIKTVDEYGAYAL